jgi:DNA-binding NarL/FixJ family response regulator
VLIVDDQPTFREAMRMVVDLCDDFECVGEAADGATAVRLVSELQPDLVLMDVQMPVMDGLAATRKINALALETRVVLLSTHESGDFDAAAAAAGAVSFIPKASFSTNALEELWGRTVADRTSGT